MAWTDIVRAMNELPDDPLGARLEQVGSVVLPVVPALDFMQFNRAIGLGIDAPAEEGQVDEIIRLYRAAGLSRYSISLSPNAQPAEIRDWLLARDLKRGGDYAKLWREAGPAPRAAKALRIELIGRDDAQAWAAVQRAAWGMPAAMAPWFTATVGRPRWHHYLGFRGNTPVVGGALFIAGEAAWLGFGATVPVFRRHGAHRAIIAKRIGEAAAQGCSVIVTDAEADTPDAPNPSYHNLVRSGFRLAYLRATYTPST